MIRENIPTSLFNILLVKLQWCYCLHRCCLQVVTNGINDGADGITKLRRQTLNDMGNLRGQTNENKPGSLAEHNKEFLGVRPKVLNNLGNMDASGNDSADSSFEVEASDSPAKSTRNLNGKIISIQAMDVKVVELVTLDVQAKGLHDLADRVVNSVQAESGTSSAEEVSNLGSEPDEEDVGVFANNGEDAVDDRSEVGNKVTKRSSVANNLTHRVAEAHTAGEKVVNVFVDLDEEVLAISASNSEKAVDLRSKILHQVSSPMAAAILAVSGCGNRGWRGSSSARLLRNSDRGGSGVGISRAPGSSAGLLGNSGSGRGRVGASRGLVWVRTRCRLDESPTSRSGQGESESFLHASAVVMPGIEDDRTGHSAGSPGQGSDQRSLHVGYLSNADGR